MGTEIKLIGASSAIIKTDNSYIRSALCQVCPARQFIPGKTYCSGINDRTNIAAVTVINTDLKSFSESVAICEPVLIQKTTV